MGKRIATPMDDDCRLKESRTVVETNQWCLKAHSSNLYPPKKHRGTRGGATGRPRRAGAAGTPETSTRPDPWRPRRRPVRTRTKPSTGAEDGHAVLADHSTNEEDRLGRARSTSHLRDTGAGPPRSRRGGDGFPVRTEARASPPSTRPSTWFERDQKRAASTTIAPDAVREPARAESAPPRAAPSSAVRVK